MQKIWNFTLLQYNNSIWECETWIAGLSFHPQPSPLLTFPSKQRNIEPQLLEIPVFFVTCIASDGSFHEVQLFITLPRGATGSLWSLSLSRWHRALCLICNKKQPVTAASFESVRVNNPISGWIWKHSLLRGDSGVGVILTTGASSAMASKKEQHARYLPPPSWMWISLGSL